MAEINSFQIGSVTYDMRDERTKQNLASVFSTGVEYTAGDYAEYDTQLYQFIVDHPAGAWDASQVVAVNLAAGVSEALKIREDFSTKAPVILNTASGDVVSFEDGADGMPIKKIVGTIVPVQDLHGYNNPWPAGGGKNLFDGNYVGQYLSIGSNNTAIVYDDSAQMMAVVPVTGGTTYTVSRTGGDRFRIAESDHIPTNRDVVNVLDYRGDGFTSGTVTTSAEAKYLLVHVSSTQTDVKLQVENGTSATPWTPYENICPISGWTGATVYQRGKNLYDYNSTPIAGCRIDNGVLAPYGYFDAYVVPIKQNTTYTYSKRYNADVDGWFCLSEDYPQMGTAVNNVVYTRYGISSFTFNSGTNNYLIIIWRNALSAQERAEQMVEVGNVRTTVEPYQGTTAVINWQDEAGTIYGGTVTFNEDGSVTLVKTHKGIHLGGLTWTKDSAGGNTNLFYSNWDVLQIVRSGMMCSILIPVPNQTTLSFWRSSDANNRIGYGGVSGGPNRLYIKPVGYTTVAEVNTLMDGQYFVATLSASEEHVFSDVGNLYTYLGTNNVWIDTGSITECEYPVDTKLFLTARDEEITGNIAPIENGATASQVYAQGAYFWHDAKFCKALTAIASGATFTLNTNYVETTVAAELLAAQN